MDDFKNFVQDLGIDAFESNIKIAGVAIISNSGSLIFQTENWDIKSHIKTIIEVMRAPKSFVFNGINFLVTDINLPGLTPALSVVFVLSSIKTLSSANASISNHLFVMS
ncbi:MAG: hypothetical protein ACFFKA_05740, partial [Candidatus Thorarchaeota archaeon]